MSLTTCLKKAGDAIHVEDRAAILSRARDLRKGGLDTKTAAAQAVQEQLDAVHTQLKTAVMATVKKAEPAASQPAAAPEKINDLGEKIGGARKDTAVSPGAHGARAAEDDGRPTWAKRFKIGQIAATGELDQANVGRWTIHDSRTTDRFGRPKPVGGWDKTFASKEDAEAFLPLAAVAMKHRAVPVGEGKYEIWRDISDRKRVKVVDKEFSSRDEAMAYMAQHAKDILETNTTFGEADLPLPPDRARSGPEHRTGDVKGDDFLGAFGFRGVEFGNWNNQVERQGLMNDAYDGLRDLADVLGMPPKALGLNGDLALAFGARGQGLSSARAHYEPDRAVINLTKENGAGSLAHEWFHALDFYFGRQDGKASAEWKVAADGTRTLKADTADAASHGFGYKSQVRPEVREAYTTLLQTMFKKGTHYVEDTEKADKFSGRAKEDLARELDALRKELSEQKNAEYYKRNNKPATAEQLAEFDTIAKRMVGGEAQALATDWRSVETAQKRIANRWTNDSLEQLGALYKAVRGRSGFDSTTRNGLMDRLQGYMKRYSERLHLLAEAQKGAQKTRMVPTEFAMNAKELDQGRGTDYWTTPHEMAARAFQGYVEDKIAEAGGVSRFLNYGPENAGILTPWGAKRPYPAGEERKAINAALERFIGVLKTEETSTGVRLYKRDGSEPMRGTSVDQVQKIVEGVTANWKNGPKVDVVASASDLPGDNPRDVRGLYTPGHIYIVADASAHRAGPGQRREIVATLAHEAVAHYGLRDMLGRQDWTRLMRNIQLGVQAGNKDLRRFSEEVRKAYVDENGKFNLKPDAEADEIAARAIEEAIDADGNFKPGLGFLKSAWAKVAQFLRDHGIDVQFTHAELQGMLVDSMRHLEAGQRTVGRGQMATAAAREGEAMHARTAPAATEEETAKRADLVGAGYHAYAGVEQVPRASNGTIADSIAKALVPAGRKDAVLTSGIIRANLGEQARGREVAQQRLMEFAKRFDKMPVAENYKFIDAMERGVPLKDPEQARAAVALRKVLDERRDQVIALGKGNLENFNENYFPHIWKDRTAAANFFSRRPLEGGKGFLKQRTYDFFADGLKAGLEPITTNPVELAMLKAREMDRYIYGQRIFGEMKDAGVAKFVAFGAKAPEGWVKINDKIARVMQYSEAEKGMILRGEYYAPEQAATLINNHLSPGLSGIAAFDMVRKAGNMMNAVQLGLSAFHLGFTTLETMISKASLGIHQASRGDVLKGAGNMLPSLNPAQPFINLYKGDRLMKAYMGNINDPDLAPIVEALVQGGGRVKMDDVYRNAAANEFRQAVRKGNYGTAAMKVLPRLLDLLNKPIFEYLVPRQKLGVFFDMAKDALEHEPGMDLERKREVMGKLWDSVDNRMGEMVYDNVFWNRALKDSLQVSVRSVGWNLGTYREFGGGVKDLKDIREIGGLSHRTSYIFGLTFVTAVIGSLTQYLLTGESPKELKDVFFPRTGKTRPDGTEDRLSLPSYMKDIYEYGHDLRNFAKYGEDPFHTVENKLHPLISTMAQMWTNKDFFGGAIRSPGDTPAQQSLDEAHYLLKQMSPFSLRNYQQQAKLKGEEPSITGYLSSPSMVGITPAPGYITKNDAQAESSQVNKMRESLVTKFREEMLNGADWPEVKQRAMDAGIRGQDLEYIRKSAVQRPAKKIRSFATH